MVDLVLFFLFIFFFQGDDAYAPKTAVLEVDSEWMVTLLLLLLLVAVETRMMSKVGPWYPLIPCSSLLKDRPSLLVENKRGHCTNDREEEKQQR